MYVAILITFFSCQETTSTHSQEPFSEEKPATVVSSANVSPEAKRELKSVEDIKKEYSFITSKMEGGRLDTTSFKYNCQGEKSGKVVYYSENGQLRMIRHTYNEYSHFSATDEYFLKEDAPFFVFYKHLVWSFVDQNQTKDEVTEKRFYIVDSRPIRCLQNKYTLLSSEKEALQPTKGSNQKIACSSLQPIDEKVSLFLKLRNQKEDLACLEN